MTLSQTRTRRLNRFYSKIGYDIGIAALGMIALRIDEIGDRQIDLIRQCVAKRYGDCVLAADVIKVTDRRKRQNRPAKKALVA